MIVDIGKISLNADLVTCLWVVEDDDGSGEYTLKVGLQGDDLPFLVTGFANENAAEDARRIITAKLNVPVITEGPL